MQSIIDDKRKLEQIEQRIQDLVNSEEYKQLEKINRAWATPKPNEQEKGEWKLLQEQIAKLEHDKNFWQKVILNSFASHVRKQDSVRKEYKRETATKSERAVLSSIADHLYSVYEFDTNYPSGPTFGDVMTKTGFHFRKQVIDYFSSKTEKVPKESSIDDIRGFFTKEQWIYFVELNHRVNGELHSNLKKRNGKTVIVLESDIYDPELLADAMNRIGVDPAHLDIKNADSDSSTTTI